MLKVDRNQFFLECTMFGIMPQVEFIDDEEGNAIDEIGLTTGISYVEMIKRVLESRKCNSYD